MKVEKAASVAENVKWSSYLIRRLPQTVRFEQIHELMRPPDKAIPRAIPGDIAIHANNIAGVQGRRGSGNIDIPSTTFEQSNTMERHRKNFHRNIQSIMDNYDETPYVNGATTNVEKTRKHNDVTSLGKPSSEISVKPNDIATKPNGRNKNEYSTRKLIPTRGVEINSIHASYTDQNGAILQGFEEVKL